MNWGENRIEVESKKYIVEIMIEKIKDMEF